MKPSTLIKAAAALILAACLASYCTQEEQAREEARGATAAKRQKAAADHAARAEKRAEKKAAKDAARKAVADEIAEYIMLEVIYSRAAALATFCQRTGLSSTTEELTGTPFSIHISYYGDSPEHARIIDKALRDEARQAHHKAQQLMLNDAKDAGLHSKHRVQELATLTIPKAFKKTLETELITITVYHTADGPPAPGSHLTDDEKRTRAHAAHKDAVMALVYKNAEHLLNLAESRTSLAEETTIKRGESYTYKLSLTLPGSAYADYMYARKDIENLAGKLAPHLLQTLREADAAGLSTLEACEQHAPPMPGVFADSKCLKLPHGAEIKLQQLTPAPDTN